MTFTECEGFLASSREGADGCKVNCAEKSTVVEGKRTMTHQGDPSLASDLPSAQDDFKQVCCFLSLPKLHILYRPTCTQDGFSLLKLIIEKYKSEQKKSCMKEKVPSLGR